MKMRTLFIAVGFFLAGVVLALLVAMKIDMHDIFENHAQVDSDVHEEHSDNNHEQDVNNIEQDLHEDEQLVQLSEEEIKKFGLKISTAGPGKMGRKVILPGEISINEDRMAHIVPGVPGIVRQVVKSVGDAVVGGEVIAWLESTKLGEAKVQYLSRQLEISCCSIELIRAQEIHDNTLKLLETLKSSPSLETLQKMNGTAMGMNRSRLISSYAEFIFARDIYLREKGLFEKNISSKEDFLKAQSNFKKADAQYNAMRDSISFEVRRKLLEARRDRQLREIELKAAERLLYVLGLTVEDIKKLANLAINQSSPASVHECNDPGCTDCVAESASKGTDVSVSDLSITNEKLAWYPIRAPFNGTIIDKHITLGEVVGDDVNIFVIADLDSVWVDLHVYQKNLMSIRKGQKVIISADEITSDTTGLISYISPMVGKESRLSIARAVLPNESGMLRPGLFVTARVVIDDFDVGVIIPRDAIQTLKGRKCVFVADEHGFEPGYVTVGRSNTDHVEVTSGLKSGQAYVSEGAFTLKSIISTSSLDSHAGHGH